MCQRYVITEELDGTYKIEQYIDEQNAYTRIPDTASLTLEEAKSKLQELQNNRVVFKCNDDRYCIYIKDIRTQLFKRTNQFYATEKIANKQLDVMNDLARE